MGYKNIFVDSDILLDLLLKRDPFFKFTTLLLYECGSRQIDLFTSTLILANIHYIIAKEFNRNIAKAQLEILCGMVKMLPFDPDTIEKALNSKHVDFEDTVQFFIADKYRCETIISRNLKHYKKFPLPVSTAEQFLRTL